MRGFRALNAILDHLRDKHIVEVLVLAWPLATLVLILLLGGLLYE